MSKRLNYSTQAIESLHATRNLYPEPHIVDQIIEMLMEGQKFQLPDNGHLLFRWGEAPKFGEPGRLPFGITIAEVPWNLGSHGRPHAMEAFGVQSGQSTKQISLSFEISDFSGYELQPGTKNSISSILECRYDRNSTIPPAGRAIVSVFWRNGHNHWELNPVVLIHPYDESIFENIEVADTPNLRKYQREQRKSVKAHGHKPVTAENKRGFIAAVLMPKRYVSVYGCDPQNEAARIANDLTNEAIWTYQLVTALDCSNVTTQPIEPSKLLQKQRQGKKNKAPLFIEHVLTLDGESLQAYDPKGGEHASPRTHLRRGHIRTLADGRRVWVNDTIVNPGNGFVDKKYDVKTRIKEVPINTLQEGLHPA